MVNLDLFYENSTQGLFIRLGDGTGDFGAASPVPAPGIAPDFNSLFTAQVNTDVDSFPDVIVTPPVGAAPNVVVLLGNGDGTFTQTLHPLGGGKSRPYSAAVGDLNGDGDPDLAVTTGSPSATTNNLVILLGDGDGGFATPSYVDHGGQINWGALKQANVAVGNLDADSNLDIVVVNDDSNNFTVLLGNGDGTFDPPVAYSTGTFARWVLLRDFDGDGELDVAVLNAGPDDVGIRLGVGDGTFGPVTNYGLGGATGPANIIAADVNFDGDLDLVTTNQGTDDISVLIGNGDGSFDPGVRFATGNQPWQTAAGDFDEDTRPDLAVSRGVFGGPSFVSVFLNTTDETPPDTVIDTHPSNPTNNTSAAFTFHGTDPEPNSLPLIFECRRANFGAWSTCTSPENYTATEGQRTFQVRAIDAAGNVDPTPASFTWVVDTTDPTITITSPTPKQRLLLHQGISPAYSCSDPLAGTPPAASGVGTCTDNGTNNETLGPHTFTVTATDNAGNTHSESVAYVIDPPRYGDFVMDDHPVAYYRHSESQPGPNDDPQSVQMTDSSGNGHHGTYKNNVALQRDGAISCERPRHPVNQPHPPRACELAGDPENRAAFFPERDGYGYVNGIPASPTGYTMEAWVKPRTSGPMMVMSHGRAGQLFIDSNQRLAFEQSQDTVELTGTQHPGRRLDPRRRHLGRPQHAPLRERRPGRALDHRQQGSVWHLDLLRRLRREGALVPRRDRRVGALLARALGAPDQRPQQDRARHRPPVGRGGQLAAQHRGPLVRHPDAEGRRPLRAPQDAACRLRLLRRRRRLRQLGRRQLHREGRRQHDRRQRSASRLAGHPPLRRHRGRRLRQPVRPHPHLHGQGLLEPLRPRQPGRLLPPRRRLRHLHAGLIAAPAPRRIQERPGPGPGRDRRRRRPRPRLPRRWRLRLRQRDPRPELPDDDGGLDRARRLEPRPGDRRPRRRRRDLPRGRRPQVPPRLAEPRRLGLAALRGQPELVLHAGRCDLGRGRPAPLRERRARGHGRVESWPDLELAPSTSASAR